MAHQNPNQIPMNVPVVSNDDVKQLCMDLLHADSEEAVVQILQERKYWDDPTLWRYYGDKPGNFSTIGNQMAMAEAALVEKVVNSIDAVLTNECWVRGISPQDNEHAPSSIGEAVSCFLGGGIEGSTRLENIANWSTTQRTKVARRITISATGMKGKGATPCFSIVDNGEGQTPKSFPTTLLSLDASNKVSIQFVQGKFNMGGTGVLRFCGTYNLQLILSKRNPAILQYSDSDDTSDMWGFTIVRRENPPSGEKSSVYTYLAPLNAIQNPRKGEVLFFESPSLSIYPVVNKPYARESDWGTVIKLYEYQATSFASHVAMPDGLLSRLDILLPEIGLPIRIHECRSFGGEDRSFETTVAGLAVRLGDDRAKNLEEGFPDGASFIVDGHKMTYTVYAFKPDKAGTYRTKREGIVFTVNGQNHGSLSTDFFARTKVKKGSIRDSILVIVDCSDLDGRVREDLFPNSRDRLSKNAFRYAIERQLEKILFRHEGLRELKEKRKEDEFRSAIEDDKPLVEALQKILKDSPSLSALFTVGSRMSNPFRTKEVSSNDIPYEGKVHPEYFKFQKLEIGEELNRNTPINMRSRITFETDATNDYFVRMENRGQFILNRMDGDKPEKCMNATMSPLRNGRVTLSISLPDDCVIGQVLKYEAIVVDPVKINPFINRLTITVAPAQTPSGGNGDKKKPPSEDNGQGRESLTKLSIPPIKEVKHEEWEKYKFDEYSALAIQDDSNESTTEEDGAVYKYYVNVDNIYLQAEAKASKTSSEVLKKRFIYGMVLIGMSIVRDRMITDATRNKEALDDYHDNDDVEIVEDQVARISSSLSPVLLPMIEKLGALEEDEDGVTSDLAGDDE